MNGADYGLLARTTTNLTASMLESVLWNLRDFMALPPRGRNRYWYHHLISRILMFQDGNLGPEQIVEIQQFLSELQAAGGLHVK